MTITMLVFASILSGCILGGVEPEQPDPPIPEPEPEPQPQPGPVPVPETEPEVQRAEVDLSIISPADDSLHEANASVGFEVVTICSTGCAMTLSITDSFTDEQHLSLQNLTNGTSRFDLSFSTSTSLMFRLEGVNAAGDVEDVETEPLWLFIDSSNETQPGPDPPPGPQVTLDLLEPGWMSAHEQDAMIAFEVSISCSTGCALDLAVSEEGSTQPFLELSGVHNSTRGFELAYSEIGYVRIDFALSISEGAGDDEAFESLWIQIVEKYTIIAPGPFGYGDGPLAFEIGTESSAAVDYEGGPAESWEVYPPLPAGLVLREDGNISGQPSQRTDWAMHTIWANNSAGSYAVLVEVAVHDLDEDWSEIAAGGGALDYGGSWPSQILPVGRFSFPVGIDWAGRPIVSASHVELGRMVGYGHEGFVARESGTNETSLSLNAIEWVCRGTATTVGLDARFDSFAEELVDRGHAVVTSATPDDLDGVDCFVTEFWNSYSDAENALVTDFLTAGGGLVMGGHSWYWSYSNDDVAHDYPGNRISQTTGLFVSSSSGSSVFSLDPGAPDRLHRTHPAIEAASAHLVEGELLEQDDADTASATIIRALNALPLDFETLWRPLREMSNSSGMIEIDSTDTYDLGADGMQDLLLNIQNVLMHQLPADELPAHPSASSFPGAVDPSAPRLNRTLSISGDFVGIPSGFGYAAAGKCGMMSTGLYAAPGEVVSMTLPASILGQGVRVLIGAHTDTLWGKSTLSRNPDIHRWWDIEDVTTEVGNSFGGPIYICIPRGSTSGDFDVTIDGAVEMPRYVHGETSLADWRMVLRGAPAPMAELESDNFILTVPSSDIRSLEDPDVTMDFWDDALTMEHELSGYAPWGRVERAVFDVQISAGWMHSGYPFMAHLSSVEGVVNGTHMRENGDWGMFHELGHNHQWMPSTLPGTTEATCNLYSAKLMTDLVGIDLGDGHGAMSDSSRQSRTQTYFDDGANIADWSVWTALETYIEVQEAFGWAPITQALSAYYTMPAGDVPSTGDEEFNEWVVQISLATGYNLAPFHSAWGFPLTAQTNASVSHLPLWTTDPLRGGLFEYDPILRGESASNVTSSSADLEWETYDNGTNTDIEVCWGLVDGGESASAWAQCDVIGTAEVGWYGHHIDGLSPGTTYHFAVRGVNGNGDTWSATASFTTPWT